MRNTESMLKITMLVCLLSLTYTTIIAAETSIYPSSHETLTAEDCDEILTHLYCSKYREGVCIECSVGSYMKNGRCIGIDANCKQFNTVTEQCVQCYTGYKLTSSGQCVLDNSPVTDSLCRRFDGNVCIECSVGSYMKNGRCIGIDANCKQFNTVTEQCVQCYTGYKLTSSGQCVLDNSPVTDSLCRRFDGNVCIECSVGSYMKNGRCIGIDANCKQFNTVTEQCVQCYTGYKLTSSGQCVLDNSPVTDSLCRRFDGNVCIECSVGSYMKNGRCIGIDANCKQFNTVTEQCVQCYTGYKLTSSGQCVLDNSPVTDSLCRRFDGNVCIECSVGSYMKNGRCIGIDANCKQFNTVTEQCVQCYTGYKLTSSGQCVLDNSPVTDSLCRRFDGNVCIECSVGSYMKNGRCIGIDANCKQFNTVTEQCVQCYTGYKLTSSGQCVLDNSPVTDSLCRRFDGNVCIECSVGSYMKNGRCIGIDANCKQFNTVTEQCVQCYTGYKLTSSGQCVLDNSPVTDSLCRRFDGNVCIECSVGSYMKNGRCIGIDANCKQFNTVTEQCVQCYTGYKLTSSGQCVLDNSPVTDSLCRRFDGNVCIECSVGSYMKNGRCIGIDANCKQFNTVTEQCVQCYTGYKLTSSGQCVLDNSPVTDSLCRRFDGNVCIECSVGSYMKNGRCIAVQPTCSNFDYTKLACIKCYLGYYLDTFTSTCVPIPKLKLITEVNSDCKVFREGRCIQCFQNYSLNSITKECQCKCKQKQVY